MTDIVERLRNLAVHCTILEYDTLADGFQSAYVEIERLRLSLSEARATGRREGMEWTVLYHDDLAAQHAAAHAHVESDHHMMMERTHRRHAAAIRAAMEKEE